MTTGPTISLDSEAPVAPFQRFFRRLTQGSYPLFAAAIAAMIWANLSAHHYHDFWHAEMTIAIGSSALTKSIAHWIDEALMALFFFVVGLEIKRELLVGGLSTPKQALLPIAAAVGGMVVPAIIYASLNYGSDMIRGWGIPMATDIAFAVAVLGLLGHRVPLGLKLFLSALAIADDLGAVLVIALFYTQTIQVAYLAAAGAMLAFLLVGNMMWVRWTPFYVFCGTALWLAVMGSGVHSTVAGVLVALFIPARGKTDTDTFVRNVRRHLDTFACEGDSCGHTLLLNRNHLNAVQSIDLACKEVETPLQRLEHDLQPWVAYGVLTLFALANAGLPLGGMNWVGALASRVTLGVALGLSVGKPLGIFSFTYAAAKLTKAQLSQGVTWPMIAGAGMLGGIGFTMSLFISGLSFGEEAAAGNAKLAIILASLVSGILGYCLIRWSLSASAERAES
jgi:NhaA family Na+:H+ antiporter